MKGRSGEEMPTACGVKNREMTENRALSGDAQKAESGGSPENQVPLLGLLHLFCLPLSACLSRSE